ncbi:MAG: PilC/PilY family type IV pilus protein [Pseudomonadota bacterium]|nr:PilC/PilY family type IV pilus protein [Pseudomonadota bacterium]
MTIRRTNCYRTFTGVIAGLMCTLSTAQATPGAPAQIPLFVASSAPANIMLLLDTSGSMNTNVDGDTRLDVAKAAAIQLLDSLENVRVGVAAFDPSNSGKNGAELLHQVADLASHETAIKAAINGLSATGYTPLAEALHDIGRYFSGFGGTLNPGNQESTSCSANGQYDGSLTLHPDSSPVSIDDDTVFHHSPALASGVSSQSPICHWCQKNFVIVLTDGEPYFDNNINSSSGLQDYDDDCTDPASGCGSDDKKSGRSYGTDGSDYLDDVAQAMYEMDLRPDIKDFDGDEAKNNVITYTVGFAIDHPLLSDTATQSGGLYFTADNAEELNEAFAQIARDIGEQIGAAAGASFSSSALQEGSMIFLTQFNSADWSGDLLAYELDAETGEIEPVATWSAKETFADLYFAHPWQSSRVAYSWGASSAGSPNDGIAMKWSYWGTAGSFNRNNHRADYRTMPDGIQDFAHTQRLAYILGSRTHEDPTSAYDFRARNTDSIMADIVHSQPVYVGDPALSWPDADEFGSGDLYSDFIDAKTGRDGVVYVGGNGGALHGFSAETGEEVLAYFPAQLTSADLYSGYHYLTDPDYTHRYYVDGTPVASDAYIQSSTTGANNWRTVLVGTYRGGGRGLFALDVTDPDDFNSTTAKAQTTVLWEFGDDDDPNIGYSFSKPTIVLLNNGEWAAIVGNGYENSGSGEAELVILYLEGGIDGSWTEGTDYLRITTGSGSSADPNGLSTPSVVDLDGDGVADRVYAGSIKGELWAFDLSSDNSADWNVAGGGSDPLFTAVNDAGDSQPITIQPEVIRHPSINDADEPNVLVLFGTGQYLVDSDKTNTDTQSFYGVWDQSQLSLDRADLKEQVFLSGTDPDLRVIEDDAVDYAGTGGSVEYGWYIDLDAGERVGSEILVRGEMVYFNTQIPDDRPCAFGGTGWLMAVNTEHGTSPDSDSPEFDLNDDGEITVAGDTVSVGATDHAPVGEKFDTSNGLPAAPAVIGDKRYTAGTGIDDSSQMDITVIAEFSGLAGRLSWDQLGLD